MQRLEVSGAVRPIYGSFGVKRLIKRNRTGFIKVALRVPSILHNSTLAALSAQGQTLRIMHYVKQVQYVETQEGHIFSHHYLWNRSTSHIVMFGYVDQWRTQEFFRGVGGVQQIQLRTENRENRDLGA